jgi:peptidoglycan/xylan/chitin deacetylase (PgdA/CDA1 family)
MSLPVDVFEQQASWIARAMEVLDLDRALGLVDRGGGLPRGTTALTFDDGYAGVHRHAFPILQRLGVRPTLFLVSGAFDGTVRAEEWVDPEDRIGYEPTVIAQDAVRELAEAGWSFGSHSHTHRDLTELSEEECGRDLRESRERLESMLGRQVRWLAYPKGRHAEHVRRAARAAGFTHALSLPEERERVEPMAVPRVGIYRGDGVVALRAKLSRWYLPVRTSAAFPMLQRAVRAGRRVAGRGK